MDRERQTLELLQLLGDEVAEAVLGRLQPERAEKLRAGMKSDSPHVSTISRQRDVLDEFEIFFQFAMKNQPQEPNPLSAEAYSEESSTSANQSASDASKSNGSDENLAQTQTTSEAATSDTSANGSSALSQGASESSTQPAEASQDGVDNAESAPREDEQMATTQTNSTPEQPALSGDPLLDLQTLSIHQLALALASEQSRTSAILLSNLPAKLTGEVLNLMKPEYQKLVMKELTKEQHAPAVLVERIARATFSRASQLPPEPPDTRDHADKVAEMLRSVPKAGRRNMLAAIEEQDPELAKSLLTRIYRFDDITSLSKAIVQRVLGEVDSTNLTTALFGAAEDVKEAIFVNLSKRARQTIEEEMQFMTNVAESRITQARNAIAEVIAKIDMEGES